MHGWKNNAENPFFERYDELLDICQEYDLTLSLGDALRPGCLDDSTDACQIKELTTLGEVPALKGLGEECTGYDRGTWSYGN